MKTVRAAALIIGLFSTSAAYAGSPGWTISESSGSVSILKAGVGTVAFNRVALKGGKVAEGDIIATGASGRAVIVRGEEYVIVSPGSRLRIVDTTEENTLTQFFQSVGNSIFKIKKKTTPHFGVQTPYLAAVVKGTTFSVTVTDSGAAVQVTEGRVQVSTLDGAATHLVLPGEIGLVSQGMPYRLTVQGAETKIIDSPNHGGVKPLASPDATSESTAATSSEIADSDASSFGGNIAVAVSEGPVQLAALTGGMISGNSSLVTTVSSTPKLALIEQPSLPQAAETAPEPVIAAAPPVVAEVTPAPDAKPVAVASSTPSTPVSGVQDTPEAPSAKPTVASASGNASMPAPADLLEGDPPIVASVVPVPPVTAPPTPIQSVVADLPPAPVVEAPEVVASLPPTPVDVVASAPPIVASVVPTPSVTAPPTPIQSVVADLPPAPVVEPPEVVSSLPPTPVDAIVGGAPIVASAAAPSAPAVSAPSVTANVTQAPTAPVMPTQTVSSHVSPPTSTGWNFQGSGNNNQTFGGNRSTFGGRGGQFWQGGNNNQNGEDGD